MKVVKFLLKAILWIVVIVIVALLALPLWFGPVVKGVANSVVPGIVKTDFHLAHLSLNPYTARFELGGLKLANPQGYSEEIAASVGALAFDAETASLATDVIHIEEITVKDVFVSYVSGGENKVNNFQQIQYNVAGGKEQYEAKQAAKAAEKPAEEKPAESKPAKKVIIDKLTIAGIKIQFGFIPLTVPVDIRLTDIGKSSGGATFEEVGQQIWASILKAAGAVGDQFKALGSLTGDAAKQASEAASKAAGQATEAAGKAASAIAGGAVDASKAVGDAAGNATKAAGEAAGKALDSLKKLW